MRTLHLALLFAVIATTWAARCPAVRSDDTGLCAEMCSDETPCPEGQGCCSNGCGHACMDLVDAKCDLDAQCPGSQSCVNGACRTCVDVAFCGGGSWECVSPSDYQKRISLIFCSAMHKFDGSGKKCELQGGACAYTTATDKTTTPTEHTSPRTKPDTTGDFKEKTTIPDTTTPTERTTPRTKPDTNMHYSDCGSACPRTCANKDTDQACTEQCVEGYFCNDGYVLDANGRCVLESNCPSLGCRCENGGTCDETTNTCKCPKGFTGTSCQDSMWSRPSDCVSWFDGCNTCGIADGQTMCTMRACLESETTTPYCTKWDVDIPKFCAIWFDGCNACQVGDNGMLACTKKACTRLMRPFCREIKPPANCAKFNDGCNSCTVWNGELVACTEMACFQQGKPFCEAFVPQDCAKWSNGCDFCAVEDGYVVGCTKNECLTNNANAPYCAAFFKTEGEDCGEMGICADGLVCDQKELVCVPEVTVECHSDCQSSVGESGNTDCKCPTVTCDDSPCGKDQICETLFLRMMCPVNEPCIRYKCMDPCPTGTSPLLTSDGHMKSCARGQGPCPSDAYCAVEPADKWAVCCNLQDLCAVVDCQEGFTCQVNTDLLQPECVAEQKDCDPPCGTNDYCENGQCKACMIPPCPRPPDGCHYGPPNRDEHNCPDDCGQLLCIPDGCTETQCAGFAGLTCRDGFECRDDPRDSCDPMNGGADCPGLCCEPETVECECSEGEYCENGECMMCPEIACLPPEGCEYDFKVKPDEHGCLIGCGNLVCSCPELACPAPLEGCTYGRPTIDERGCATDCGKQLCIPDGCSEAQCAGFAGLTCRDGYECRDDPRDSCDPMNGGADCPGLCCKPETVECECSEGEYCEDGECMMCPEMACPAPPEGCEYDFKVKPDEHGCLIGCGNLVCSCPEIACTPPREGCVYGRPTLDERNCPTDCGRQFCTSPCAAVMCIAEMACIVTGGEGKCVPIAGASVAVRGVVRFSGMDVAHWDADVFVEIMHEILGYYVKVISVKSVSPNSRRRLLGNVLEVVFEAHVPEDDVSTVRTLMNTDLSTRIVEEYGNRGQTTDAEASAASPSTSGSSSSSMGVTIAIVAVAVAVVVLIVAAVIIVRKRRATEQHRLSMDPLTMDMSNPIYDSAAVPNDAYFEDSRTYDVEA